MIKVHGKVNVRCTVCSSAARQKRRIVAVRAAKRRQMVLRGLKGTVKERKENCSNAKTAVIDL